MIEEKKYMKNEPRFCMLLQNMPHGICQTIDTNETLSAASSFSLPSLSCVEIEF